MTIACRTLLVGVVVAALWAAPGMASLDRVAVLRPPAGTTELLGPVAVSGQTLAVSSSPTYYEGGPPRVNAAFVFNEPAGGWSDEDAAAQLVDSTGAIPQLTGLGVSGGTIVVGEYTPTSSFVDVFVKPSTGWAGTLTESARLMTPGGALYQGAQISGDTVVVTGQMPPSPTLVILVFTRPPTGWSGVVSPSAVLADSGGHGLGGAAIQGRTIVADAGTHADVFVEPSGGWNGRIDPTATLRFNGLSPSGGSPAIDGSTILDGSFVYSEPRLGWRGTIMPSAFLRAPAPAAALSGSTAALEAVGFDRGCPCGGTLFLFARPGSRWAGELLSDSTLSRVTLAPPSYALQNRQLFLSGTTEVDVYNTSGRLSHVESPPSIRRASLTGLASGKPNLRIAVTSGPKAWPFDTITIRPPKGLRFTHDHGRLLRHLAISGTRGRFHATLASGSLRISVALSHTISIGIRAPALTETRALSQAANRRSSHPSHLRLHILITNPVSKTTKTIILSTHK